MREIEPAGRGLVRRLLLLGAAVVAGALPGVPPAVAQTAVAPAPSYLVERLVSIGGEVQRVSVFCDGTAVLVMRSADAEPKLLEANLNAVERRVIEQAVADCVVELERLGTTSDVEGPDWIELRLAPPGRAPLVVRTPVNAIRSLQASRLMGMLDNLQQELKAGRRTREDLSAWVPEMGQRVEIEDGRILEVADWVDVTSDAPVLLHVVGAPVSEYWALAELRRRAVRLVEK